IKVGDRQRIGRALEVWRISGRPISDWQTDSAPCRFPFRVLKLVLAPKDRAVLHGRIEARFDAMLVDGLLDEVRRLRAHPALQAVSDPLDLPALRAVGYRQAWRHLDGITDATGFRSDTIAATRQLAKRQLTWLRGEVDARWFDPQGDQAALDQSLALFVGHPEHG
ncbi:MAG TPA: tRNA dimethylallyltransferase, partial [Xanthomonadaceae bacterium]|nr:tRNA dimethylallyltransferase [Xanthomonadaceae bacterium]